MIDLLAEYRRSHPEALARRGNGADVDALFKDSPLVEQSVTDLEVDLPVPDGETYWRWTLSQGAGRPLASLPDDVREELHARLVAEVDALPLFWLQRSASLLVGRVPT